MSDSHLKGTECLVNNIPSYVVQADRAVGITLHALEDDRETSCLNREETLEWLDVMSPSQAEAEYDKGYDCIIEGILVGKVPNVVYNRYDGMRVEIEAPAYMVMQQCAFK